MTSLLDIAAVSRNQVSDVSRQLNRRVVPSPVCMDHRSAGMPDCYVCMPDYQVMWQNWY